MSVWFSGLSPLSCTNPFTTREPAEPESDQQAWVQPGSPEIVLENLRNAILDLNVENYMRTLSDPARTGREFRFVADPSVAAENPGLFAAWSREHERSYFSLLRALTPDDSLHVLSLQQVQSSFFADSAFFVENYTLRIHHTQQDQNIPAVVQGEARFWLAVDELGEWSIYRWEDRSLGSAPPWSVLKEVYGK